ncbi:MAG: GxxExxY protein [Gemmatimonadales bacterium]
MDRRDELTYRIIGAAIAVSKGMGPRLLESVYETCLADELRRRGMTVDRQQILPVVFQGRRMERGFRADIIVAREVLVEVKAVTVLLKAHEAQVLNYMRLAHLPKGLLINFNAFPFVNGIRRYVL